MTEYDYPTHKRPIRRKDQIIYAKDLLRRHGRNSPGSSQSKSDRSGIASVNGNSVKSANKSPSARAYRSSNSTKGNISSGLTKRGNPVHHVKPCTSSESWSSSDNSPLISSFSGKGRRQSCNYDSPTESKYTSNGLETGDTTSQQTMYRRHQQKNKERYLRYRERKNRRDKRQTIREESPVPSTCSESTSSSGSNEQRQIELTPIRRNDKIDAYRYYRERRNKHGVHRTTTKSQNGGKLGRPLHQGQHEHVSPIDIRQGCSSSSGDASFSACEGSDCTDSTYSITSESMASNSGRIRSEKRDNSSYDSPRPAKKRCKFSRRTRVHCDPVPLYSSQRIEEVNITSLNTSYAAEMEDAFQIPHREDEWGTFTDRVLFTLDSILCYSTPLSARGEYAPSGKAKMASNSKTGNESLTSLKGRIFHCGYREGVSPASSFREGISNLMDADETNVFQRNASPETPTLEFESSSEDSVTDFNIRGEDTQETRAALAVHTHANVRNGIDDTHMVTTSECQIETDDILGIEQRYFCCADEDQGVELVVQEGTYTCQSDLQSCASVVVDGVVRFDHAPLEFETNNKTHTVSVPMSQPNVITFEKEELEDVVVNDDDLTIGQVKKNVSIIMQDIDIDKYLAYLSPA